MTPKKIPMRMCVGCREMRPKRELIRIVRKPDGAIVVDKTGKVSGRGAYICPRVECFDKARKIRAIERALEHKLEEAVFDSLKEALKTDE